MYQGSAIARAVAEAISERVAAVERPTSAARILSLLSEPVPTDDGALRLGATRFVEAHGSANHPMTLVVVVLEPARREADGAAELQDRFKLTPRESAVALRLGERQTNSEIAEALGISVHTARHHVERVLRKMKVKTRAEAAELVARGLGGSSSD